MENQPDRNRKLFTNRSSKKRLNQTAKLFLLLGAISVLSVVAGAALSKVLSSRLLRHAALPHSTDNITATTPVSLDRPINILVLGIDNSGHPHTSSFTTEEALAGNSDTMLLVRLLPKTHEVNILSIPRDTLIHLPNGGADKINDANIQGGTLLAAETVSQLLGNVQIDRYVRVDTEGFTQLIDALGGVEITVPKRMDYVDRSQKLQIHISPGRQKLNGQHLQEYVRFRHDELGDIGRVQRQQIALKAISQTLVKPESLLKVPQITEVVQRNVDTDLSVGEIFAIYSLLKGTDRTNIHMLMLPGRFSRNDEYSLSYWIKEPQATNAILAHYFDAAKGQHDSTHLNTTNTSDLAQIRGQIRVAVINATNRKEIPEKVAAMLRSRGFYQAYASDRDIDISIEDAGKTLLLAQQGNPEIAEFVKHELGIGQVEIAATGDITSDVTLIVGSDFLDKSGL